MSKVRIPMDEIERLEKFRLQLSIVAEDNDGRQTQVLNEPFDVSVYPTFLHAMYRIVVVLNQHVGQVAWDSLAEVEGILAKLYKERSEVPDKTIVLAPSDSPEAREGSDLEFWKDMMPDEFVDPAGPANYILELAKRIQNDIDEVSSQTNRDESDE